MVKNELSKIIYFNFKIRDEYIKPHKTELSQDVWFLVYILCVRLVIF